MVHLVKWLYPEFARAHTHTPSNQFHERESEGGVISEFLSSQKVHLLLLPRLD